jgi:hypothetical protein
MRTNHNHHSHNNRRRNATTATTTMVNINESSLPTRFQKRRSKRRPAYAILSLKYYYVWLIFGIAILYLVHIYYSPDPEYHRKPMRTGRVQVAADTTKAAACKYHGNCPTGTVCERIKGPPGVGPDSGPGKCLPYMGGDNETIFDPNQQKRHDTCVSQCLTELKHDEAYFYGSDPIIEKTSLANHGHGCVITFKRTLRVKKEERIPIEEWMNTRFHRVVRVDLSPSYGHSRTEWNALCDFPCTSEQDCDNNDECSSRYHGPRQTQTCRRRPETPSMQNDMVIVTGADDAYYYALRNFAASLKYWAPRSKLVVYNLGMKASNLEKVKRYSNVIELAWEDGIPSTYPPHVQKLYTYAWKSLAINETVHKYKSIFWLDAGATFTGPITAIQDIIHQHGIFLVHGQDNDMKALSHPDTYKWFGIKNKDNFQAGPHYAGGIQGHVYPSRYIDTIVVPNAKCALDVHCIAPEGASMGNHRFDQTSLSILAYGKHVRTPHYTEYLAGDRKQLNANMSLSNGRQIMWTARAMCSYYNFVNL